MSQADVERLIGRVLLDADFRQQLLAEAESAIRRAGFELDEEEMASLMQVKPETVLALAECLEERASYSGWWIGERASPRAPNSDPIPSEEANV